jgi:hypothetical protein
VELPAKAEIEEKIEAEDSGKSFEEKFGQVWLVRIGKE